MNIKFKEECIIVIGTWTKSIEEHKLLINCISSLSLLDVDICLVSHYPVSSTIQSLVSYYVYDKYNESTPEIKNEDFYWNYYPIQALFKYSERYYSHHSAVLTLQLNGFSLAKALNKKYVFYTESDTIIDPEDLHSFYDVYEKTLKNDKRAWFAPYIYTGDKIVAIDGNFFFSEVDFYLTYIDSHKTNWGKYGIESHIYNCLLPVKDQYLLEVVNGEDVRHIYQKMFPNSVINQNHGRMLSTSKYVNPDIKNYHLLGGVLLPEDKTAKLNPLVILINYWPERSRDYLNENDVFRNKDNNFKISYIKNNRVILLNEINLNIESGSWYQKLPIIESGNEYRVKVELYNEYSRSWDMFLERKYTLDDVEYMRTEGLYDFPENEEVAAEGAKGRQIIV